MNPIEYTDYIMHHGIKGQKWGIRRFQNEDGSLTDEGRERYRKDKVFVSGSSKTQFKDSGYYRKELPKYVKEELLTEMKRGSTIMVGDAPGIDRQVQNFLKKHGHEKVEVYSPGNKPRYLANKKWKSVLVDAPEFEPGSKEWLAKKDIAMSNRATKGLAVILDEGSSATRKNIDRLIEKNAKVKVYQLSAAGKDHDGWVDYKEKSK